MNVSGPAPVVVGLSPASGTHPEVEWAAREAELRHRPLHIVHAWDIASATTPWDVGVDRLIRDELAAAAARRVRRVEQGLARDWPAVEFRSSVVQGVPWHVLARFGATSELTVVGTRGYGRLRSLVVGSVASALAAHATRPVVVVRGPDARPSDGPAVVVGVDGSPLTQDVLAFGFDHASRHRRPLRALFCYSPDVLLTSQWSNREQPFDEQADRWLSEVVSGWQEKYPDVRVRRQAVRGHPVPTLLSAAHGQELLVLGSTSHHPRLGSMLGSVSLSALHHGHCAIAIVPGPVAAGAEPV